MTRLVELSSAALKRREVVFLVVGGINTAVGLLVFALLYWLLGDVLHYMGALVLAYVFGTCTAFFLHRRYTFQVEEGSVLVDFVRFSMVQGLALALNAVFLPVLVESLGIPVLPAQVLSLGLVVICSYFAHLTFSFRR